MKNFILLVEDNPDDELLIRRVLRKNHISNEVLVLHDGAEAVQWLLPSPSDSPREEPSPELMLLSLKLPKVSGPEVLGRIRDDERTKNIPVVVLTSSDEEGRRLERDFVGPNAYVTKPVDFAALSKVVSNLGLSWTLVDKRSGL